MKLVIFDKDGTLVEPVSGDRFVQHPEDQKLLPCVAKGLAALTAERCMLAIASNQAGVAAGHKTLDDAIAEMWFAMELVGFHTGCFCPDFEGKECYSVSAINHAFALHRTDYGANLAGTFRKPGHGMITNWREFAGLHGEDVLFVGDRPEDEQAAAAAGVSFMWADEWRAQYVS